MTDFFWLADLLEGRGREARAHKEMVAAGPVLAEAEEALEDEEEEEVDTTITLVNITVVKKNYIRKSKREYFP